MISKCKLSNKNNFKIGLGHYCDIYKINLFRSTHEVVSVDGMLYALGGNDGSASLNSMERFVAVED